MSVATHLGIKLSEYDRVIRTFIPYYREILDVVADTVSAARWKSPRITDLGTGTGALSARGLAAMPRASVVGIDSDSEILEAARRRLARHAGRVRLVRGSFLGTAIPRSDAVVATFALHHIRTPDAKRNFYRRCRAALGRKGVLVTGDVFLADDPALARHQMKPWQDHLLRFYAPREARGYLAAWSREDRYFRIGVEMGLLRDAGFKAEVVWRRAPFAVIAGRA